MSKKLDIEFIKAEFTKEDYELLTAEYKNAHQKLDYVCPKGHKHSISWSKWRYGRRCPKCSAIRIGKKLRHNIEFIRSEFEKEGYTLLTTEYRNNKQKLDCICSKGHRYSINWADWKQKKRCRKCFAINVGNRSRYNINFIRKEFKKENYELLTTTYKNVHQKLEYICSNGHKHSINWGNWVSGYRCPYCVGLNKPPIELVRSEFEKEGYTLLTIEYKNSKQKLDCICSMGHKHKICWSKWKMGRRCPFCNNTGISKWEKTVKKFVDKLSIDYISNDRAQLVNPKTGCNLELDVWFPKLKKAIECNGLYWHSKDDRKECDKTKQQLCKDQGIDLLIITDKEWDDDINKCKDKIQEFLC